MEKIIRKFLLILLVIYCFSNSSAQNNIKEISLSIPFIWNKYEVTNTIGPKRQISGQGWSYGGKVAYSRFFSTHFFATIGVGTYKQNFNLKRPFNYPSITLPLYTTQSYYYLNWQWLAGLGYRHTISNFFDLRGKLTYNQYYSYKQYYQPQTSDKTLTRNNNLKFGGSIITTISSCYHVVKKYSVCFDIDIPVFTQWHKDAIFEENPHEHFSPQKSFGIGLSFNYIF